VRSSVRARRDCCLADIGIAEPVICARIAKPRGVPVSAQPSRRECAPTITEIVPRRSSGREAFAPRRFSAAGRSSARLGWMY